MRKSALRWMKKSIASVMAVALIVGGCLVIPTETQAAQGKVAKTGEILYVEYDAAECEMGKAPTYTGVDNGYGYLFGGWFELKNNRYDPINKADGETMPASGKVYAKFVPAYVLSVKCQNFVGTEEDSTSTNLRIVSSVDSRAYRKVGFDLMKIVKNEDGTYTKKVLGKDGGQTTTKTYTAFAAYTTSDGTEYFKSYTPQEVFGEASQYLTAWRINNIKNEDFGTIYCIRPYWVTQDETTVYGLTKYAHVEDGYLNYINVPVNLNNANDVVAGLLNVSYDKAKLEVVDIEHGRVFEEMETLLDTTNAGDGIVKCIANRANLSSDVSSNDVYINIRFKAVKGREFAAGVNAFDFKVTNESFSDASENLFEGSQYNVWNVKSAILK